MMEWVAIFGFAAQYGTIPVLVVLIVVLVVIARQLDANGKADKARHHLTNQRLGDLESLVKSLQLEYLPKAEFYKEVGGWRTDLVRLSDKIDEQSRDFRDLIISLWKTKAEEDKKP